MLTKIQLGPAATNSGTRRTTLITVLCLALLIIIPLISAEPQTEKPRVVILSDFPPLDVIPGGAGYGPANKRSDPDDVQSMIRFLLYTNEFDVQGLVATSATLANIADKQGLLDLLDLYDRIDGNLQKHDKNYPTADDLRAITWQGRSNTYGRSAEDIIGPDMDSEASDAIIDIINQPDPRPVWFCIWGGSRELAQALYKIKSTNSPAQTKHLVRNIRVYMVALQDGSGQWLLDTFPSLFIILSKENYKGMFFDAPGSDVQLSDIVWLNKNLRSSHGLLGAMYPETGWNPKARGVIEGDSPSFLHLLSAVRGINDPEQPDQPGWGGRFVRVDSLQNHWIDHPDGPKTVWQWRQQVQADFAQRADWMRNP